MSRELCIMACVFCREWAFQRWAHNKATSERYSFLGIEMRVPNENLAKKYVLAVCQVASRRDLDRDPEAAERFHELVRKPFLEWKERQ